MKRKLARWVYLCWMGCWMCLLGMVCFPVVGIAQTVKQDSVTLSLPLAERKDSVSLVLPTIVTGDSSVCFEGSSPALQPVVKPVLMDAERAFTPLPVSFSSDSTFHIPLYRPLVLPYYQHPSSLYQGDFSTGGILATFPYGVLSAAGSQTTLPGIGRINEAALGYQQQWNDRWSLQVGLQARKFHIPYAVGQQFGASGMLQYQAADRLAFRVFGAYATGPSYGFSSRSYGGSMLIGISDRFSLEMGLQRQYNPLQGGWETVPMLVPTYKFNKFDLGIDVGGLLYQLMHEVVIDNDRMRMGNPTIAPPSVFPK